MFKAIQKRLGVSANQRTIKKLAVTADLINDLEPQFEAFSDQELRAKTDEFKQRLANNETLDDLLPETFAVVREASKRTIGLRHYDIQLVGGMVLHQGIIAEMRTGEGKTLVSTLPIYLNALAGRGVHLVTVNDYLARRDARWMAPIYNMLGMSVGVLQMAARTEHGKKAFLVNLEKTSPHEDQHQLDMVLRKKAYLADITYGTTSEFGFDYLRDNMARTLDARVQRGLHHFAIIDEVDNVLIDEARTPLIISGPSHEDAEQYERMASAVKQLRDEDVEVDERARAVSLTEIGEVHIEEILGEPLRDPERPEDSTPEQERMLGYLEQALMAQNVYKRNKEYIVQGGKVIIVDENTGRMMPGRRWSNGLHQAIEAKEGARVQAENVTYATITIQNYYRMYVKLSGMTGTADTEKEEFFKIYQLDVAVIPTNLDYQSSHPKYELFAKTDTDEERYKYTYYVTKETEDAQPQLFKRKDYPDVIFRTEEAKFRAIGREILRFHTLGRPILLGTTSVDLSEVISSRLKTDPIRRLAQTLLLRDVWFTVNNREEDGREIDELQILNRPLGLLPIKDMRKMARELNINVNPQTQENLDRLLRILHLPADRKTRLASVLKDGVSHQVLNARKHTEESQIIAGAGAFGAVTIATNMAGRGVDIKLGGEMAEEVLTTVGRILKRNGYDYPYEMTLEAQEVTLLEMPPEQYGIYEGEIEFFLTHMKEARMVKELGGLHVIGTERHESRRIDNQLRGRAGRQGDSGSSRFYLSMQDRLMRLFGGEQAESFMERLKIDEAMPIEMKMVTRIVEQSQTRVEGANFDTRKHLLEYDDVLNSQRETVYGQRDRIFTKDDLTQDVTDMLRIEVERRVPEAVADEEGPWKMMAWLSQTQPPIIFGQKPFPSYTYHVLLRHLAEKNIRDKETAREALLEVAANAINAEKEHLNHSVSAMLDTIQEQTERQLKDRIDTLDIFFEGLSMEDETDTRSPRDLQNELISLLRAPFRFSNTELRLLRDDPDQAADNAQAYLETYMFTQGIKRVLAAVERRLEESLNLDPEQLSMGDWDAAYEQILAKIEAAFAKRHDRYIGQAQDGLIAKDITTTLNKLTGAVTEIHLLTLLMQMRAGQRATFDRKTKRRVWKRTTRMSYVYYAASFLKDQDEDEIIKDVFDHLENAKTALSRAWGFSELSRLANTPIKNLAKPAREGLQRALNGEMTDTALEQPLGSVNPEKYPVVIDELGRQATTQLYRQLLLNVISNLWIDYLTQMEALRVAVRLEAYGQRDPLVTYKSKASEMFQKLITDMRTGVVSRMFTYQPQAATMVQTEAGGKQTAKNQRSEQQATVEATAEPGTQSKKRRRRRRRKK